MDDLLRRIQARVADPKRAVDSASWVRPLPTIAPVASVAEIDAAEVALGFALPPLLRRLFAEVGNGGWGPHYGLYGVPVGGAYPDENDLVGFYLACAAPERAAESPAVAWPKGMVTLLSRGCIDYEICDFLRPPYPVFLLRGDTWELERPLTQSLTLVAPSLAERLEAWLTNPPSEA